MPRGEDKYHWALLTGPKTERDEPTGKRYHAKEQMISIRGHIQSQWQFDERDVSMLATSMILVRIVVGKIKDRKRVASILRSIPIRGDQPGWNCVGWVKEALEALGKDGKALGTSVIDWRTIRDAALSYVRHKEAQHRFDGRAQAGIFNARQVPTYDLIETKQETIP
ncbi:hypothetical protein JX265_000558 [Neoarthrinium moseri]|uniref:Uncharacterized protein n=1 Tax=Neoarthrinium moseri TaxID=1658444 RepID=A0A9Q0AWD8_9PEZI|nr:hypothetical protein JX265_000558 [Neoarthrinium moseri]